MKIGSCLVIGIIALALAYGSHSLFLMVFRGLVTLLRRYDPYLFTPLMTLAFAIPAICRQGMLARRPD